MRRRLIVPSALVAALVATTVYAGGIDPLTRPQVLKILDQLGVTVNGVYTPPSASPTLADVLAEGADAEEQNITGLAGLAATHLSVTTSSGMAFSDSVDGYSWTIDEAAVGMVFDTEGGEGGDPGPITLRAGTDVVLEAADDVLATCDDFSITGNLVVTGTIAGALADVGKRTYVHNSGSAQTVANDTTVDVTFVTEALDELTIYADGGDETRFTAPSAQRWRVSAEASWAAHATGGRFLSLQRFNAANALQEAHVVNTGGLAVFGGGTGASNSMTWDFEMAAGDYVKIRVRQDSGGDLAVTAFCSVVRVR